MLDTNDITPQGSLRLTIQSGFALFMHASKYSPVQSARLRNYRRGLGLRHVNVCITQPAFLLSTGPP